MRFIINTVNLDIGGAHQRAVSFLNELRSIGRPDDEYHIFITSKITAQVDITSFKSNFSFYNFFYSPASLRHHWSIVRLFNRIEKKINPNVVFSFVGPAYWRPRGTHLVGFGIPHLVYTEYGYVKKLPLKTKFEMAYKKWWTIREADFYVVQTEDVKKRIFQNLGVADEKIFVVSNGIGSQYKEVVPKRNLNLPPRLLIISRYRAQKNYEVIVPTIVRLKSMGYRVEFHLTIEDEVYNKLFKGLEDWVINHGPVKAAECPGLYNECDALFLPSHLECFSASYPEAMKMKRPIITSNLSFAKTVCGDAALYIDNIDPDDVANKIILLFQKQSLYDDLVRKGTERLSKFLNSTQQAEAYLDLMHKLSFIASAPEEGI